jgi:hypothetical protein
MSRKIVLEIPDDVIKEIDAFKDSAKIPDEEAAIFRLLRYALSMPPYFKDFDWQIAEKEADEDILEGRIKEFASADDFLTDLKA